MDIRLFLKNLNHFINIFCVKHWMWLCKIFCQSYYKWCSFYKLDAENKNLKTSLKRLVFYLSNTILLSFIMIVSRKFMLSPSSISIVNCIRSCNGLNVFNIWSKWRGAGANNFKKFQIKISELLILI